LKSIPHAEQVTAVSRLKPSNELAWQLGRQATLKWLK
jgi:hypothetical protein